MSTSPPREGSANPGSANGLDEKPRLSEHEKKANHIASGTSLHCLISSPTRSQVTNHFFPQNKSADKLSAKVSTVSQSSYRA